MRILRTLAPVAALLLVVVGLDAQGYKRPGRFGESNPANQMLDPNAEFAMRTLVAPPAARPGGIVSVQELRVPPKAVKEFERSRRAFRSGEFRSAVDHLEKAIQIAPDFVEAHNNLATAHIRLREYQPAVVELQKAIDLDPKLEVPYHNLAWVLIRLSRLPEAEAAARRALELAPQHASARLTLGRILALEGRNTLEAVQLLIQASIEIPEARLPLAHVLQQRGQPEQAVAQLQAYAQDDPAKRARVEAWLAQLTEQAKASVAEGNLAPTRAP
jgi:Flp pilus assembly protein TadD